MELISEQSAYEDYDHILVSFLLDSNILNHFFISAIIPQEPILFNGTLRSNLDPWNSHTDVKLWDVIHKLRFSKKPQHFWYHRVGRLSQQISP